MEVTLRKADAIEKSIQAYLLLVKAPVSVTVNKFMSTEEIKSVADKTLLAIKGKQKLLVVLYSLRARIKAAESDVKVDMILNTLALNSKMVDSLSGIANSNELYTAEQMEARIEDLKKETLNQYREKSFEAGIFTKEQIDSAKKEIAGLVKTSRALRDELLDINVKTKVSLEPEEVLVLEENNLL